MRWACWMGLASGGCARPPWLPFLPTCRSSATEPNVNERESNCIVFGKQRPTAKGDEEMVNAESSRFIGRSMQRREDRRLLTGRGQFIADLTLPGMLHAVFVRSQIAHGRIRRYDIRGASAMS